MGCGGSQPQADAVPPEKVRADTAKTPLIDVPNEAGDDGGAVSPKSFRQGSSRSDLAEGHIVLRVIRADLSKNFDSMGKMDPFASVVWMAEDGSRFEASKTRTDWGGHMTPVWNHTCRSQKYCRGDRVEIQVWEKDMIRNEFCGCASIAVEDLTPEGSPRTFPLVLNGESTGTVTIQALSLPLDRGPPEGEALQTNVDPALFESPVKRMGVSGGTAPFFHLALRQPAEGRTPSHFLGKDLSHANDEITFYEEALAERRKNDASMMPLLNFMFDYAGVVKLETVQPDGKEGPVKELLVMRNLRDGYTSLRMLDLKIGQVTAQAGWQGKSRLAAVRQSVIDGITNSAAEGFRLEGFDGRPPTLSSQDPLLDLGGKDRAAEKTVKKATRIMLQRLPAPETLAHFFDVHQEPADPGQGKLADVLAPIEVAEIVNHEVVRRLFELAVACRKCPVPQKWIGSSVALGFECGHLPERSEAGAKKTRQATHVNIFDWGRSELNTLSKHMQLTDMEQRDRSKFWGNYVGGIDRLSWEASRAYEQMFSNSDGWGEVTLTIYDFDSMTRNDMQGKITIPVEETPEKTVTLAGGIKLTFALTWRALPQGSRLKGTWRLNIVRAKDVPPCDGPLRKTSDPFCEVLAVSKDTRRRFRQCTCVKMWDLNPEWNEVFDLPVAAKEGQLQAALNAAGHSFGGGQPISEVSVPEGAEPSAVEEAIAQWRVRLDSALTMHEAKHSGIERLKTNSVESQLGSQLGLGSQVGETTSAHSAKVDSMSPSRSVISQSGSPSYLASMDDREFKYTAVEISGHGGQQYICCSWV